MFVFVWQRPRKTTSSGFYQFFKDNELRKNWDKYLTHREQDDIICTQQIKSTFRNNIWKIYISSTVNKSTQPSRPNPTNNRLNVSDEDRKPWTQYK